MELCSKTEEKILRAAREIFLQKGRDGARMQEIADLAGINKALLHYYFRSKDRLYDEIFTREVKNFFRGVLGSVKDVDDVHTFLKSFIDHYIDSISREPRIIRFILWEIERGGKRLGSTIVETMNESNFRVQQVREKIQNWINRRQIREIDPIHLMVSLIGMCLFPFISRPILERLFPGIDVLKAEFLARRKQEIYWLIWQGIQPESE